MKKQIRNVFCSFFNSFLTSKNQLHIMRSTGMTTQQNVPEISFLKRIVGTQFCASAGNWLLEVPRKHSKPILCENILKKTRSAAQ